MKECGKCNTLKGLTHFLKRKYSRDGYRHTCKECIKLYHSYNHKKAMMKANRKEGYCAYIATYKSGTYIGSGLAYLRRGHHLGGTSRIAKSLKEKALSFEVVYKGNKENCLVVEQEYMDYYGLNNLFNKQRALKFKQ